MALDLSRPSNVPQQVAGALSSPYGVTTDGISAYFASDGQYSMVFQVPLAGGSPLAVYTNQSNQIGDHFTSNLYFSGSDLIVANLSSVVRLGIGTWTPQVIKSGLVNIGGLVVDNTSILLTRSDDMMMTYYVSLLDRTSGTLTDLTSGFATQFGSLALDGESAYWCETARGAWGVTEYPAKLMKAPRIGGTPTELLAWTYPSDQSFSAAGALDGQYLYWTDTGRGYVFRVDTTDGTSTTLASAQSSPTGIVVDTANVYWINAGDGSIRRVAKQ
ncbi:MAG: YncE family protein [Polyangia bacterium]